MIIIFQCQLLIATATVWEYLKLLNDKKLLVKHKLIGINFFFLDMLASSLSSAKQTNLKTLKMKLTDKLSPCLTIELDLVILFINNLAIN